VDNFKDLLEKIKNLEADKTRLESERKELEKRPDINITKEQ
jgi:hypothetical protein